MWTELRAILRERRGVLVLALVAAAVAAYAWFSAGQVRQTYQFVFDAPAQEAPDEEGTPVNAGLAELRRQARELTESLNNSCCAGALYAVAQPVAASAGEGAGVDARLTGIEETWYALESPTLIAGRLIYPDELERGERVAMVDESLAVALYHYAQPVGETVTLGGEEYRIVGVYRRGKRVGDQCDHSLVVPLGAMQNSQIALSAMVYEAVPISGTGGWPSFQSAVGALGKGTAVSLVKESMNATLCLRFLCVAVGAALGLLGVRLLNLAMTGLVRRYRLRLMDAYALRLTWWLGWRMALLLVGYAVCAWALAQAFMGFVAPVYTFPEWVPKVLVEPADISAAFWNVWQSQAAVRELRTPELLRLRFMREVCAWATGALALWLGMLWGRLSHSVYELARRRLA